MGTHFGLIAGAASMLLATVALGQVTPSQPASDPNIRALIQQLGEPEFSKREEALQRLLKVGPEARDQLEAALQATKNPEIEPRLTSVLNRIDSSPPVISLTLKDATTHEMMRAFNKAAGVAGLWHYGDGYEPEAAQRYTIKAENKPYWETFMALAEQAKWSISQRPGLEYEVNPNGGIAGPYQFSGPFVIFVLPSRNDKWLRLRLCADPRLKIVACIPPEITSMVDGKGNSVMPAPEPGGIMWRKAPVDPQLPGFQDVNIRIFEVALRPEMGDAKRIGVIKGKISLRLDITTDIDVADVKKVIPMNIAAGSANIALERCDVSDLGWLNLCWNAKLPADARVYYTLFDGDQAPVMSRRVPQGSCGVIPRGFKGPAGLRFEWPRNTRDVPLEFELKDIDIP